MPRPKLYRTSIEIWTAYDPGGVELEDLAREAIHGDAICSAQNSECRAFGLAPDEVRAFMEVQLS